MLAPFLNSGVEKGRDSSGNGVKRIRLCILMAVAALTGESQVIIAIRATLAPRQNMLGRKWRRSKTCGGSGNTHNRNRLALQPNDAFERPVDQA